MFTIHFYVFLYKYFIINRKMKNLAYNRLLIIYYNFIANTTPGKNYGCFRGFLFCGKPKCSNSIFLPVVV